MARRSGTRVLNDALKLVEDNAEEHGPAQIDSKLFSSGAIPTLVDLSKEAEMIVVGCRGLGPCSGDCWARSVPDWYIVRIARSRSSTTEDPLMTASRAGAGAGGD